MSQHDNGQANGRQRRVERYAGELLNEPSMNAPQPIPGKPGKIPAAPRQQTYQPVPRQTQPQDTPLVYPVQTMQQYPAQQSWSQQYPVQQPVPQQSWSQQYPPQQNWSQQYPVHSQPSWQGGNGYTPPPVPPPPPMNTPPASSGGGKGGSNWWKLALLAVVLLALIALGISAAVTMNRHNKLVQEVAAYNDRYCEGVYVDDIHLGGMTQDEAYAAVVARAQQVLSAWHIDLTYNGRTIRSITAADLGMTVDVNDALEEAWNQGHNSSDVDERKAAMDTLLETPFTVYTAQPSGDTSVIDGILQAIAKPVKRDPVDATVTFVPENHTDPFEYTAEIYGSYLDIEPIKAQIYAMVENMERGSIELVPQSIAPQVTEAQLRATHALRGAATTDISTMSTEERTANIQRASELINGTVLKPGESFSFNGVVGARSAKNGFYKAIEYAYGQEREGYGGGVCQSSTTVYLAAIRADMTITKREPHSDKVNYTDYGLDATVNLDGKVIDLTFKNTTGSNVYIMSYLVRKNGRYVCHVDIYGEALPEGVTYDLVAETVEVLKAPTEPEYIEDKTGEKVYYIDDEPVQIRKASDGCVVETFKVKYVNGKEVDRTYVARDTYKAKSQQLYVGIHEYDE